MKVIQINVVYPNGSTGKLVKSIHDYLVNNGISSYVLYGRGKRIAEKNVIRFCGNFEAKLYAFINRISGLYYGSAWFSTSRLMKQIEKINPDIVDIHCINGHCVNIPRLVNFLGMKKINLVVTLHAEFMYTGNCGHALECDKWINGCCNCLRLKEETHSYFLDSTGASWRQFDKAFWALNSKNVEIVSVSPWLMERAKQSHIIGRFHHSCIYNGVNTDLFTYRVEIEPDNKQILFVTPFFTDDIYDIKGGRYLIELARLMPDYHFIVAGAFDESIDLPENVKCIGNVSNQSALARLYSGSLVTVLLSKKETFSMVTVESLCCGTPVVGFKCGAPERIALKDYSCFFEQGDIDSIKKSIEQLCSEKIDRKTISEESCLSYSDEIMGRKYLELYGSIIQKQQTDNSKDK